MTGVEAQTGTVAEGPVGFHEPVGHLQGYTVRLPNGFATRAAKTGGTPREEAYLVEHRKQNHPRKSVLISFAVAFGAEVSRGEGYEWEL